MLALETVSVRTEMGHTEVEEAEYHEAWAGVVDSIIFLESKGGYGRTDQGSSDALADLRAQHDAVCFVLLCVCVVLSRDLLFIHGVSINRAFIFVSTTLPTPVTPAAQRHGEASEQGSQAGRPAQPHHQRPATARRQARRLHFDRQRRAHCCRHGVALL